MTLQCTVVLHASENKVSVARIWHPRLLAVACDAPNEKTMEAVRMNMNRFTHRRDKEWAKEQECAWDGADSCSIRVLVGPSPLSSSPTADNADMGEFGGTAKLLCGPQVDEGNCWFEAVCVKKGARAATVKREFDAVMKRGRYPTWLPQQKVAARQWTSKNAPEAYLCKWKMGSGKTYGLMAMIAELCKASKGRLVKVLIVCSNTLVGQWSEAVHETPQGAGCAVFDIVGYERFRAEVGADEHVCARYDVLAIDESHHYRNLTATMRYELEAMARAPRLVLLTGTPIQNDETEVEALLRMLRVDPAIARVPPDFEQMTHKQQVANRKKRVRAVAQCLRKKRCVLHFDPSEADPQRHNHYPSVQTTSMEVEMDVEQTIEYLMSRSRSTNFGAFTISTARSNRYNCLTRSIANTCDFQECSPKFALLRNILMGRNSEFKFPGPFVVYSHFRERGVDRVPDLLPKSMAKAMLTGSTSARDRDDIRAKFNNKQLDVLFITDAGRDGVDLLGAGTIILLEPHENLPSESQTINRVVRHNSHPNGKDSVVHVVKLISTFPKWCNPSPTCKKSAAGTSKDYKHIQSRIRTHLNKYITVDDTFDGIGVIQQMIKGKGETIDQHLTNHNQTKYDSIAPWCEMLANVGRHKSLLHKPKVEVHSVPSMELPQCNTDQTK